MTSVRRSATGPPIGTIWIRSGGRTRYPIWDQLRKTCPIAHTNRFLGAYLPTRYEDVRAIAHDTEHFSSQRVVVRDMRPENPAPAPPITLDPPHHKRAKQVLLPFFTRDAVSKLEPKASVTCNELIDRFIGETEVDAAEAYSRHVPARIITFMLGVPEGDSALFNDWSHRILEEGIIDEAAVRTAVRDVFEYFAAHVERIRRDGGDNLISDLMAVARRGAAAVARAPSRHAAPSDNGRHRHHVERHQRLALAPRQDARGSPTPHRRA